MKYSVALKSIFRIDFKKKLQLYQRQKIFIIYRHIVNCYLQIVIMINIPATRQKIIKFKQKSKIPIQWAHDLANKLTSCLVFVWKDTSFLVDLPYWKVPFFCHVWYRIIHVYIRIFKTI